MAIVEEPAFAASESLRVELGDRPAMVQAVITTGTTQAPAAASTRVWSDNATQDLSLPHFGTSNTEGSRLTVFGGQLVSDAILAIDLAGYGSAIPETATVSLEVDEVLGGGVLEVSASWDHWGLSAGDAPLSDWDLWDSTTLTGEEYATDLLPGFRETLDSQSTPLAGEEITFDVTEAVQRALLAGDVNFDGVFDGATTDRVGDIEALYLAIRDWERYQAEYGGLEVINNGPTERGLLYRADVNWDGVVDETDFRWQRDRLNFRGGDFNLDGFVDGYDYALWQANFGSAATSYRDGDGNADGNIDTSDYTVWRNTENLSHGAAAAPRLTLRGGRRRGPRPRPVLRFRRERRDDQPGVHQPAIARFDGRGRGRAA